MAPIKIYPPAKLPEKGVTDMLFNVWVEELEVYLGQDDTLSVFMDGGAYAEWQAYDANADRINQPQGEDAIAQLPLRRRQLRTFLSIIAKSCDINHYNIVTRHSTSLQWIYTKLREDYDIQQKGIHFFNLLDLKFQPGTGTNVVGFYNQYRNLVIANLKKTGRHHPLAERRATARREANPNLRGHHPPQRPHPHRHPPAHPRQGPLPSPYGQGQVPHGL